MDHPTVPDAARRDLLVAEDLTCIRDDRVLFAGLSLRVAAGEVLQIQGPNGSGKTSLLRILCGLLQREAGSIRFRGEPVDRWDAQLRRQLAYLGHLTGVTPALTAAENLRMFAALHAARLSAAQALERVGLAGMDDVLARHLSAGQRQRLALCRLLLQRAKLWVLDEPATALDRAGRASVRQLIEAHVQGKGAVILTTHQPLVLEAPVREFTLGHPT